MRLLAGLATGLFMFGMVGVANADWIDLDLDNNNTNRYFLDTVTNYAWLDTNFFANMTPTEMQAALPTGFQLATQGQIEQMDGNRDFTGHDWNDAQWYHNYGGVYIGSQSTNMAFGYSQESLTDWYWNNTTSEYYYRTMKLNDTIHTVTGGYDPPDNYIGVFAVNTHYDPVPEPATMLLFGTGLVGLAGVTSRRRKK